MDETVATLPFQILNRADQFDHLLDGVHSLALAAGVDGLVADSAMSAPATDHHPQPLEAALDRKHRERGWLEEDRAVRPVATIEAGAGARTARFLVDDRLQDHVAGQPDSLLPEQPERR